MTRPIGPQRVATVSFGALLLCLAGGGTALAATMPDTGTVSPTWSTPTSILPGPMPTANTSIVPSPTPLPTDLSSVTSALRSLTASTSSPAATPTSPLGAASGASGGGSATDGGSTSGGAAGVTGDGQQHSRTSGGSAEADTPADGTRTPAPPPAGSLAAGAARAAAIDAAEGRPPVVAPQRVQLMAAGRAPALAPTPRPAFGGSGGRDPNVPRGLLVALATMVVGGLAAGHAKTARMRLAQLGIAAPRYRPTHRRVS